MIRNDIFDEWVSLTPKTLEELLVAPKSPMVEFQEIREVLRPIVDRFTFVKEGGLAEQLDGHRILAFTSDREARWVLGLYLISICEVLEGMADPIVLVFTFSSFITGEHFNEVFEGLTLRQRQLLIEVSDLFLKDLKEDVLCGMTAQKDLIPDIADALEKWREKIGR